MDLFNAALPNVMFLVGIAAISIGLGIELKIVPVGNQVGRSGRIGAMAVGTLLVLISIIMYLRPSVATTAGQPTATAAVPTAVVAALVSQPATPEPPTAAPAQPTATPEPSATTTPEPSATLVPPTATPEPPTATLVSPTATPVPPSPTPAVSVPDLRGMSQKDAERALKDAGLSLSVAKNGECKEIGAEENDSKVDRGRIRCQNPAPGSGVEPGTAISVILAGKEED